MEMPECPICLQNFDSTEVIPRVLSCGHSICEFCIKNLPPHFPDTIRCPSCNQIVKYLKSQGPTSLPKNIDLLRFLSQSPQPHKNNNNIRQPKSANLDFYPQLWTEEFYSNWKNCVLPSEAVVLVERGEKPGFDSLRIGKIASLSSNFDSRFRLRVNEHVSLLLVSSCPPNESEFKLSYIARVMESLYKMTVREKSELGTILRASLRQRQVCKVYGLWMDSEEGLIFLVSERPSGDFSKMSGGSTGGITSWSVVDKRNSGINDAMFSFAMVGMELCQAVMGLHSEGIVSGCLAPSYFSFDNYGHLFVYLNDVLLTGRRFRKIIAGIGSRGSNDESETDIAIASFLETQAFVSPELFELLCNQEAGRDVGLEILHTSDVWSLGCVLVWLLLGDAFSEELFKSFYYPKPIGTEEICIGSLSLYMGWMEKVASSLNAAVGPQFDMLVQKLCQCLNYDPRGRPSVRDLWRCMRELLPGPHGDVPESLAISDPQESATCCLILGDLCHLPKASESRAKNRDDLLMNGDILDNFSAISLSRSSGTLGGQHSDGKTKENLIEGLHLGTVKSLTLQGHLDCITGLAVGGDFLFSCSFDKTVRVWSLQDFSLVQSLRGHEHRVMSVVLVEAEEPLCITGDSGGGIFVWGIDISVRKEPLKKWHDHTDWRYSGIHSLAVSGVDYLYSGSGDKSIKAWSLQDYTLTCTMHGHKAVVSCLAACDGILYSGSWDGTIRLWWLNDHSPLTVLEDSMPGNITSVLSLSVDHHMLVASHENGCIKMWKNDKLVKSMQTENGAIFALEMVGKLLFTGGWNKIVSVQELLEDDFQVDTRPAGVIPCGSVITSLSYYQGKLFVGFSDKLIKVYYQEADS